MRILILLLFVSSTLLAQDFDDYQLLKNEGNLPEDFITSSAVKYEKEIADLDKTLKRKDKKDQEQFFLESNYTIDDLLLSGQVFYNNEVTRYVNKVADKILKDDPTFRKQLRIYVVRSSSVNAFATNQGIILVNMGLLAQLENEAQLAYILCHEMIHVKHAHALDMFLVAKEIDRNTNSKDLLKKTSYSDVLVSKNHYSKELETEADDKGLDLYLKTDYSLDALDGVFDVLEYSHLPFDEVAFDKTFFNNKFITISDSCFLKKEDVSPIEPLTDEDEARSTHPSIDKRRLLISSKINLKENEDKKLFLVAKEEFERIQKTARYELVYYFLRSFKYQEAIYAVYLLMREDTTSKYLKKSLAKALHGLTKFKHEYFYSTVDDPDNLFGKKAHENIQGSLQQVYYLFRTLKKEDLTVLALRYVWDLKKEYPKDSELDNLLDGMFDKLTNAYDNLDSLAVHYSNNTSPNASQNTSLGAFVFNDIINEDFFKNAFVTARKREEERAERRLFLYSSEGKKYLRKKEKQGARLGIDSVLAINPYYIRLDARNEDKIKVKYQLSEKNQLKLCERMSKNAKMAGLHLDILDINHLDASKSTVFNESMVIRDWLYQQHSMGDVLMPSVNQDAMNKIMKKYGTQYLMVSGVISINTSKSPLNIALAILVGIGSGGFYMPYAIHSLVRPSFEMLYYAVLFDTKTQSYELLKYDYFNIKDSRSVMNAHMYDVFNQIKKTQNNKR